MHRTNIITHPKTGLPPKKLLMSIWWDSKGVVYFKLLDKEEYIIARYYCTQLKHSKKQVKNVLPLPGEKVLCSIMAMPNLTL